MIGSNSTTESISGRGPRIFIYTSAFSTHPGRNSRFLSENYTRGYEKPSHWNSKTISYARGVYLDLVMVIFIFFFSNSSLINCFVQQTEMSTVMNSILENQAELMKEVKSLRKENQQLRQMLWLMVNNKLATFLFGSVSLSYLVGFFVSSTN